MYGTRQPKPADPVFGLYRLSKPLGTYLPVQIYTSAKTFETFKGVSVWFRDSISPALHKFVSTTPLHTGMSLYVEVEAPKQFNVARYRVAFAKAVPKGAAWAITSPAAADITYSATQPTEAPQAPNKRPSKPVVPPPPPNKPASTPHKAQKPPSAPSHVLPPETNYLLIGAVVLAAIILSRRLI